jgi:hypothetical protein
MTTRKNPKRSDVYVLKSGEWIHVGQRNYYWNPAVDAFVHAWPALAQKRQQSGVPHPWHPNPRITFACASEDEAVQS